MKKIISLITSFLIAAILTAQNLDTVNVSLTLRAQDWAWAVGKYGAGGDSLTRSKIRALRTAIIAANPPTWTTDVTINNVPGGIVIWIYNAFQTAGFGEVFNMGSTNAERTTIYTNIRAINNSAIQYFIGVIDANMSNEFLNNRKRGKEILLDQ